MFSKPSDGRKFRANKNFYINCGNNTLDPIKLRTQSKMDVTHSFIQGIRVAPDMLEKRASEQYI